jgi:hypothetical protein
MISGSRSSNGPSDREEIGDRRGGAEKRKVESGNRKDTENREIREIREKAGQETAELPGKS